MKISRERKKVKGFTLVELVIVVAIVIVLSAASVPIYRSYVDKAKMTEAYSLLGTILTAQKAYYSEYGNFLFRQDGGGDTQGWTTNSPVLGIDVRGNKYATLFWIGGGDGTGRLAMKYYFNGDVFIPEGLSKGKSHLGLEYNITTGAKYFEY